MRLDLQALTAWLSPRPAARASSVDRERIASVAALGREHLRAARGACDQRLPSVSAELYAGAIARFAEARAIARAREGSDGEAAATPSAIVAGSPSAKGEAGTDAQALLAAPAGTASLGTSRRRKALALLDRVADELERGTYPASDAEVRTVTVRRRIGAGVLGALVLALAVHEALAPHNVARGKPVTASSIRFGSPQGLVNGAIEWGTFGLHTGGSGHEWATIDLEKFYSLDAAEIYSRGDGRFEFNLPLQVELSDDGSSFRPVGACTELFTQSIPCVVDLHRERARYVRVTAPEVVLAEVEVYGR